MIIDEDDYLAHYGIIRRSGRYPWGSGGNEDTSPRHKDFLDYVAGLRKDGLSEVDIAKGLGMTVSQLRKAKTVARAEHAHEQILWAERLRAEGNSNVAAAKIMGIPESSYRALLAPGKKERVTIVEATANILRGEVEGKRYIDVGRGVENHIGISKEKLAAAVSKLQEEGYKLQYIPVAQLGTGKNTNIKVLTQPDVTYSELYKNRYDIAQLNMVQKMTEDQGRTWYGINPPLSINPRRVDINYKEDGGDLADGVIYVREGVPDVSLGKARYAQVRILVGDNHYLKGMAMYKDDLPDGVDLVFNTNKSNTGNKFDAMKKITDDPNNPFSAVISNQIIKRDANGIPIFDKDGKEQVTSAMNIVNEEGNWEKWSKSISSQVLSKQSPVLAKQQLDMTYERRQSEYKEIMRLTNPAVKKKLLEDFAEGTDAAAVHLKAAALPRQSSHVILPVKSLPPTQVYAPNYDNGDTVVLIRYPHGGTFEIPELTVNNNHPEAKRLLGKQPRDAIGINPQVAQHLSGADFDGDTVLVIRNNNKRVKADPPLQELKNFDPMMYKLPKDSPIKRMKASEKQQEMGKVSNLITDMTIAGAPHSEIARAVKHSMVVIDAEKHELNYKQSEIDNGIAQLKAKYQGGSTSGASTIISRAGGKAFVPERKQGFKVDPATGKKIFTETGATNFRTGKPKMEEHKKLEVTDDAFTLLSNDGVGTPIERLYATHSNKLKTLANQARKDALQTPPMRYSPSAKKTYAKEVERLNSALYLAQSNAPLERQAQLLANHQVSIRRQAQPDMDRTTEKKIKSQILNEARTRTGAGKDRIIISQSEWDAIQAGAISNHKLTEILRHADADTVKKLATPKTDLLMTSAKTERAQAMLDLGYTQAEVAAQLGVSLTTLKTAIS